MKTKSRTTDPSPKIKDRFGVGRRPAFAQAFDDYPTALFGFAGEVGLATDTNTPEEEAAVGRHAKSLMARATFRERVVRCLAAQFCTRIFVSRALIEREGAPDPTPLDDFAAVAVERLDAAYDRELEGFRLISEKTSAAALTLFERYVAKGIFTILSKDAGHPKFEEVQFWQDVFLGLADADRTGAMGRGFADVFLDHTEEYRQVLDAVTRATRPH